MTKDWIIEQLIVAPTQDGFDNVVVAADWRCNGHQGQYDGTCYGTALFSGPSKPFTAFDDLTQEQVLNWCYSSGVDKASVEAYVQSEINKQINPEVIYPALPWA